MKKLENGTQSSGYYSLYDNKRESVTSWAVEAVGFVFAAADSTNNAKIMGGTGDRTFSPGGLYTKQQAFITIKRLYNTD